MRPASTRLPLSGAAPDAHRRWAEPNEGRRLAPTTHLGICTAALLLAGCVGGASEHQHPAGPGDLGAAVATALAGLPEASAPYYRNGVSLQDLHCPRADFCRAVVVDPRIFPTFPHVAASRPVAELSSDAKLSSDVPVIIRRMSWDPAVVLPPDTVVIYVVLEQGSPFGDRMTLGIQILADSWMPQAGFTLRRVGIGWTIEQSGWLDP